MMGRAWSCLCSRYSANRQVGSSARWTGTEQREMLACNSLQAGQTPRGGPDPDNLAQLEQADAMMKPGCARARIAVIDDDAVLAQLAQTLLADEGFEVLVCSNWREAHA